MSNHGNSNPKEPAPIVDALDALTKHANADTDKENPLIDDKDTVNSIMSDPGRSDLFALYLEHITGDKGRKIAIELARQKGVAITLPESEEEPVPETIPESKTPGEEGGVADKLERAADKTETLIANIDSEQDLGVKGRMTEKEEANAMERDIEKARAGFVEKMHRVEKIESLITKENLTRFAQNHENFNLIIKSLGIGKAINAIKSQLKVMSITEVERFDSIAEALEDYEKYRVGEFAKLAKEVQDFCDEAGINYKNYLNVLNMKDDKKREEALIYMSQIGADYFRRMIFGVGEIVGSKWMQTGKHMVKVLEFHKKVREGVIELKKLYGASGGALRVGTQESTHIKGAIEIAKKGKGKMEDMPKHTTLTFEKAREKYFGEKEIAEAWKTYKEKLKNMDDAVTSQNLETHLIPFLDALKETRKKALERGDNQKEGFWSQIFSVFADNQQAIEYDALRGLKADAPKESKAEVKPEKTDQRNNRSETQRKKTRLGERPNSEKDRIRKKVAEESFESAVARLK